jgi:antitoxin component YwqK of YwqJK toxin-antitoxin module
MRQLILILAALAIPYLSIAQSDTVFNQVDARNFKQGWWKKSYPNGKTMYLGFFKDNHPVGTLYRYYETGAMKAILKYTADGSRAHVQLLYEDGQTAATGAFVHSLKDSTWEYFSYYDRSLTARENWRKGERHGPGVYYYSNGVISEKVDWIDNKKEGSWEQYFQNGTLKLKSTYVHNMLEGSFLINQNNGSPYLKGTYRQGRPQGKWILYKEDGSISSEIEYLDGKPLHADQLTEEQQTLFRAIEANEGKFDEPDETDFIVPQQVN